MTKTKKITRHQKQEIVEARSYKVVKANDLIQKSRFSLTTQEQKIILYLISKIKPGREALLRWIDTAIIDKNSGIVKLGLHTEMRPTSTLVVRSQYALRLYELLKSYEHKGKWRIEIDELKKFLSAESYERCSNFKQKILDIALREINDMTDIDAGFEAIKKGRKFIEIEFVINRKGGMNEQMHG